MRNTTAIVIPIRSLTNGKSRLAGVLQPDERKDLNQVMLEGVLRAATGLDIRTEVVVISLDPDALDAATEFEPSIRPLLQDPQKPGLNPALVQATQYAIEQGVGSVVILPADLPLVQTRDVEHLLRRDSPVVIAPDRHQQGTNGLLQRLDATRGAFRYQFGLGSFARHQNEAHRLGLDPATAVSLGTSFDLDTPSDLEDLDHVPGAIRPIPRAMLPGD